MKETVREMMARAEDAWREYHEDRTVSAWELSELLETEDATYLDANGSCRATIGFDPIFRDAFVRLFYWESAVKWAVIKMCFDKPFGWEMRVECQGGESELERVCFELMKEKEEVE